MMRVTIGEAIAGILIFLVPLGALWIGYGLGLE